MGRHIGFLIPVVIAIFYGVLNERIPHLPFGDPLGPRAFPRLIVAGLVLSALLWFLEMRPVRNATAQTAGVDVAVIDRGHLKSVVAVSAWLFLYILLFKSVGFVVDTAVFLLVLTSVFYRGHHVTNVIVSLAFTLGVYFLFVRLLGVSLPSGVLPF
jgi:putative tricarboxylic transport membrane protein